MKKIDSMPDSKSPDLWPETDVIGKTIESERFPITLNEFWFAIYPNSVISPFDFVSVENILDRVTVGIVKELRTVQKESVLPAKGSVKSKDKKKKNASSGNKIFDSVEGIRIARIAVMDSMLNSAAKGTGQSKAHQRTNKPNLNIRMPVGIGKPVRFAETGEIIKALGIPIMENPVFAGIIEMTNGLKVPIPMSVSYLAGPDSAHVNASGISGNLKTTYLLFLLYSIYQKEKIDNNIAIVIFNTREDDLLHLHEPENVTPKDRELLSLLKMTEEPFTDVTYLLPRGTDGKPISTHVPPNHKTYSFELEDIYDRLDLLLSSEAYDPRYNLSSIVNYIYEYWPLCDTKGNVVRSWSDLFSYKEYPQEIMTQKTSFLHFMGYLQKFRKSSLFTDKRETSIYLGDQIKKIKPGDVFVIDIAMVPTVEEQSLVVGDVMKNIDQIYSSQYSIDNTLIQSQSKDGSKGQVQDHATHPILLPIFIDEVNRFLPTKHQFGRAGSVAEQIVKTLVAGKSRNTVLFSAQQFASSTDMVLHEHTGIHVMAKLGLSEMTNRVYDILDDTTKRNITHLDKGELVMVQPAFRHPIKISIPRLPFKRQSR